ncbi:MAG: hypothetical protein VW907_05210 [Opitutae bacterium]
MVLEISYGPAMDLPFLRLAGWAKQVGKGQKQLNSSLPTLMPTKMQINPLPKSIA